jgi:hypothetical protein
MTNLYRVEGSNLASISRKRLEKEDDLQRWIAENPRLIGLDVLILGREISAISGRIDILAMDSEGNTVVIECKRDRTPRDIIAQILDYASWVHSLSERELDEISLEKSGKRLADLFYGKFQTPLPDSVNASHSLVIVSSEFDSSSKRIVEYLAQVHGVAINSVFFSTFDHNGQTLIATNWLMDQEEVVQRAESKAKVPWSGLWFVNVGNGEHRSWEDMRKYGFIAAGHGRIYSDELRRPKVGDPVLAYQKSLGYVGYGLVTSPVVPVNDFLVDDTPILLLPLHQPGLGLNAADPDLSEYLVGVDWKKTFSLNEAKSFPGVFANQHIVCRLRDAATIEFLKKEFPIGSNLVG